MISKVYILYRLDFFIFSITDLLKRVHPKYLYRNQIGFFTLKANICA